jgi:hypothetical protein
MFSKSSILARPGWSPKVFEELMGPPDEIRKGPNKTQLFKPERVDHQPAKLLPTDNLPFAAVATEPA